jgi:predicted nuclease of predicted toxin-antitoxin system
MKIKLDENLPSQLTSLLIQFGHDVDTVHNERLIGYTDDRIWEEVQKGRRFLITQDLDFSDLRRFAPGSHHGILLMRLRMPSRKALTDRVNELFQKENVGDWIGCFVVATERKIRVLKPEYERGSPKG